MHSFATKSVRHRRLLGAGLVAVATLAGSTNLYAQLSASGFGQAPTPPPPAPVAQPPVILSTGAASSSAASERADYTIQINEVFSLRHEEGGLIKDVLASRPGIVQIDVDFFRNWVNRQRMAFRVQGFPRLFLKTGPST